MRWLVASREVAIYISPSVKKQRELNAGTLLDFTFIFRLGSLLLEGAIHI